MATERERTASRRLTAVIAPISALLLYFATSSSVQKQNAHISFIFGEETPDYMWQNQWLNVAFGAVLLWVFLHFTVLGLSSKEDKEMSLTEMARFVFGCSVLFGVMLGVIMCFLKGWFAGVEAIVLGTIFTLLLLVGLGVVALVMVGLAFVVGCIADLLSSTQVAKPFHSAHRYFTAADIPEDCAVKD